ncbi:transposase, partial [Gaoshiqia sediminis]
VGLGGYAIGYDIFEGNIYEGHTLIPFIEKISAKFKLNKPVVVADAGLLSNTNIKALEQQGYEYIIGARLKNEPDKVKKQILETPFSDGQIFRINKSGRTRLIV